MGSASDIHCYQLCSVVFLSIHSRTLKYTTLNSLTNREMTLPQRERAHTRTLLYAALPTRPAVVPGRSLQLLPLCRNVCLTLSRGSPTLWLTLPLRSLGEDFSCLLHLSEKVFTVAAFPPHGHYSGAFRIYGDFDGVKSRKNLQRFFRIYCQPSMTHKTETHDRGVSSIIKRNI